MFCARLMYSSWNALEIIVFIKITEGVKRQSEMMNDELIKH